MGFAKYFNRDIIALNKRITSKSDHSFKEILQNHIICVEFDEQVNDSNEAQICLELLIRILTRFYPKIQFSASNGVHSSSVLKFEKLAKEINSNIEITSIESTPTFILSLSKNTYRKGSIPHLFVGSNGWFAKLSQQKPLNFGTTNNPFGSSLAACVAASNLFRYVFMEQLNLPLDSEVELSAYDFTQSAYPEISVDNVKLDDLTIVGIGAIGSSTVWALSKLKNLTGKITLVDHDKVEESNLQRYILLKEKNINNKKVDVAKKVLRRGHLKVTPQPIEWAEYIHKNHKCRCDSRLVVVAVDSKNQRINIQSSLPKKIINAYTDESRFGISRHPNFNTSVCLACLYMPTNQQKSRLDIIVDELNMRGQEKLIYAYMQPNKFIDDDFLRIFCDKNQIPLEDVQIYKNRSFGDFYIEMVCGYKMIEIQNTGQKAEHFDVPLSFQSCMAGIMLAAEIVIESKGLIRENVRDVTQYQVLDVINENNPSHISPIKNHGGNCICGDLDYLDTYKSKWEVIN